MKKTLEEMLHVTVSIEKKVGKSGLPFYLTAGRDIFDVQVFGVYFSAVILNETDNTDIRKIKHQKAQYESVFQEPVAFCIPDLTRTKRVALVKAGIPFIAPPSQVYLPFLGLALQEKYPKIKEEVKGQMTPLEQQLFLWLLYNNQERTKSSLAEELKVTRAAITKVTESLNAKELITEKRIGKEVLVSLSGKPRECYAKAREWMRNPIKKTIYCEAEAFYNTLPMAGESALSELSMLSAPKTEIRACYEKDAYLKGIDVIEDERWIDGEDFVKLEIWKYDPGPLRMESTVDILSLELSLEGIYDERVVGEMQVLMEENGWL